MVSTSYCNFVCHFRKVQSIIGIHVPVYVLNLFQQLILIKFMIPLSAFWTSMSPQMLNGCLPKLSVFWADNANLCMVVYVIYVRIVIFFSIYFNTFFNENIFVEV